MAIVYIPPTECTEKTKFSVFLAGSIDMGAAPDWQAHISDLVDDLDINIFNPRRITTPDDVKAQIEWELRHLEMADMIVMYLSPTGLAPISLLEFGLYIKSGKLLVCCPPDYMRAENVRTTAEFYGMSDNLFTDFADIEAAIRTAVGNSLMTSQESEDRYAENNREKFRHHAADVVNYVNGLHYTTTPGIPVLTTGSTNHSRGSLDQLLDTILPDAWTE